MSESAGKLTGTLKYKHINQYVKSLYKFKHTRFGAVFGTALITCLKHAYLLTFNFKH